MKFWARLFSWRNFQRLPSSYVSIAGTEICAPKWCWYTFSALVYAYLGSEGGTSGKNTHLRLGDWHVCIPIPSNNTSGFGLSEYSRHQGQGLKSGRCWSGRSRYISKHATGTAGPRCRGGKSHSGTTDFRTILTDARPTHHSSLVFIGLGHLALSRKNTPYPILLHPSLLLPSGIDTYGWKQYFHSVPTYHLYPFLAPRGVSNTKLPQLFPCHCLSRTVSGGFVSTCNQRFTHLPPPPSLPPSPHWINYEPTSDHITSQTPRLLHLPTCVPIPGT